MKYLRKKKAESFDHIQDLIDALKRIRKDKNLTTGELASLCQLDRTTLHKLENGILANPTVQTITKIAEALDVSIQWVILRDAPTDEDQGLSRAGFLSLWDFASRDRHRASRILCFLASARSFYPHVFTTPNIMAALQAQAAEDEALLYRWSTTSKSVDVIARALALHGPSLTIFLSDHRFDPTQTYNPDRAQRDHWFRCLQRDPAVSAHVQWTNPRG